MTAGAHVQTIVEDSTTASYHIHGTVGLFPADARTTRVLTKRCNKPNERTLCCCVFDAR